MKDFPVFTTYAGTASLILREIPYKKTAYIMPISVLPGYLMDLAAECVGFCRAAGAERVYLSWEGQCPYDFHTEILTMSCSRDDIGPGEGSVFPVLPENVGKYRAYYNEAMGAVDNAATMESREEAALLEAGGGYFVHKEGRLLGLGQLVDGELRTVISREKGGGEAVVRALAALAQEDTIRLQVASTNERAIRLYTRLGFLKTGIKSRWYRVFP